MIFMALPASAIMYASGSSDGCSILLNSDCNSDSGSTGLIGSAENADSPPSDFFPSNVDSSSSDGSTDDNADSPPSDFLPLTSTHHHLTGLLMITLIHHHLTSFPLTSTHHHLTGLLMIVVPAHQQRLRKITPLYQELR